jgi:multiple sugar transport system ATP-binding protein
MIAGLEEVTDGRIEIGDRDVTHLSPRDRDIAMVFQNYALYPHLSVERNLAYGLRVRKTPKSEIKRRVHEVAEMLGIEHLLQRRPSALSGGQRQRVAMGRAIVREPAAFLMDEPLSNLDAKLRVDMRAQLAHLHAELQVTTVYVTHDQVEAMTLGQRVAVMRDGKFQQVDSPQNLYRLPRNLFVAAFIGSPSMNLLEADLADGVLRFAAQELPVPNAAGLGNRRVIFGVRPTDFVLAAKADPRLPRMTVTAEVVEDLGSESHVIFPLDAPRVVAEAVRAAEEPIEGGETLFADDQRALFTARIDAGGPISLGATLELAVDTGRLHFFDPATGAVLGR